MTTENGQLPAQNLVQAIKEIHYVNHLWKASQGLFGPSNPLARSLRDTKGRLQIRLLINHPDTTGLEWDNDEEGHHVLSIRILDPTVSYQNAAHIPFELAKSMLAAHNLSHILPTGEPPAYDSQTPTPSEYTA